MNQESAKQSLLDVVAALSKLSKQAGLKIHATVESIEPAKSDDLSDQEWAARLKERKRSDFAWLQSKLSQSEDELHGLRGNYVAIYEERIVSFGPDKDLTSQGAAKQLKVDPEVVLVLPVLVSGSEEEWKRIAYSLGIELSD